MGSRRNPPVSRPRLRATMTDNEIVRRLMWSGLVAGLGALATVVTTKVATLIWHRVFGEDPPE